VGVDHAVVVNDIAAVLLDLDDTLILEEAQARARLGEGAALLDGVDPEQWQELVVGCARALWYASALYPVFKELGVASWEGLWATFEGSHPRLAGASAWVGHYRLETWRSALRAVGADPDLASSFSGRYIESQRSGHPLLPGAADLVRRVAAAVPAVVVTNGPPDIQRLKLDQTGLRDLFSAVVISGELGLGKPDPAVMWHALEQVDVPPERAVMVGDSWDRDVMGALAAGVRAVWLNHGPLPAVPDPRVTVASDLSEVLPSLP
jgi:putative hydrolase of the HAD superfamily